MLPNLPKHNAESFFVFFYLKYKELNHRENSTNSLTTTAGDPIPNTGTMSTLSHDSTIPPTKAPATSPPTVISDAFPESHNQIVIAQFSTREIITKLTMQAIRK